MAPSPTGRRKSTKPLIEIARAETKAEAVEGLERWKARHADVWPLLEPRDVLVDSMRGRSTTWTRIRLNLEHVPAEQRPAQEPLEVDYDPWAGADFPTTPVSAAGSVAGTGRSPRRLGRGETQGDNSSAAVTSAGPAGLSCWHADLPA